MKQQSRNQALVWGGLLIIFGVVGLVESFTDLNPWAWVAILAITGLGIFGVFLWDRSEWWPLIPTYVLWAIAGLLALIELNVLDGVFLPAYVLPAIALPFIVVYLRDRAQWWALIPAYVLIAVAALVLLSETAFLPDAFEATFVLTAIALPFLVVYLRNRSQWWPLIPAYVLLSIGVMTLLEELGILSDFLVPAYVMFVIAIPFFVVYIRNPSRWWPLIPGGIMAAIGLSFLMVEAFQYVFPALVILVGLWILIRSFTRKEAVGDEPSLPVGVDEGDLQSDE
jgi:TM2 domain-containing membrane protein YozV